MIFDVLRKVLLGPVFLLALAASAEAGAAQDRVGKRCDFDARGAFTSNAGGRIDVSPQGIVFESVTSKAQLTIKAGFQVVQVRVTELSALDFYREVVSLYPRAFESVRLPACVMLIRKGAHRVGLLPVPGGLLFVEVSDHDPPATQVFLSK